MADDWDDLFAKAEGIDTAKSNTGTQASSKSSKKRSRAGVDRDARDAYLEDRWNVTPTWPPFLELHGSMSSQTNCSRYDSKSEFDTESVCQSCRQPSWCHWAAVAEKERHDLTATIICTLRNIRCAALQGSAAIVGSDGKTAKHSSNIWKKVMRQWDQQSFREGDLLDKIQGVSRKLAIMIKAARSEEKEMTREALLRLIISCDEAYYALYYSQITSTTDDAPVSFLVPHPVSYFGVVASPIAQQKADMIQAKEESTTKSVQEVWGLEKVDDHEKHPLQVIHGHRLLETQFFFQDVSFSLPSDERRRAPHEALACDLLMDWRDSCRDFVCHLYAYATVPPRGIQMIKSLAKEHGSLQTIIELGAGTGYLARILEQEGVTVKPFDILPTRSSTGDDWNEYHGQTPAFTTVHQGDERVLSRQGKLSESTLLLCYPPPESEFALRALDGFMKAGGQRLVFIGEFKGLTGSLSFEKRLVKCFHCVDRVPCYSWGNDATSLSIWELNTPQLTEKGSLSLLPCTVCGRKESTRRCRLLRFLCYCSSACFNSEKDIQSIHLKLASVHLGLTKLEFNSDELMAPL